MEKNLIIEEKLGLIEKEREEKIMEMGESIGKLLRIIIRKI